MEILAVLERRGEEKRGKGSRMKEIEVTESLARRKSAEAASITANRTDDHPMGSSQNPVHLY